MKLQQEVSMSPFCRARAEVFRIRLILQSPLYHPLIVPKNHFYLVPFKSNFLVYTILAFIVFIVFVLEYFGRRCPNCKRTWALRNTLARSYGAGSTEPPRLWHSLWKCKYCSATKWRRLPQQRLRGAITVAVAPWRHGVRYLWVSHDPRTQAPVWERGEDKCPNVHIPPRPHLCN